MKFLIRSFVAVIFVFPSILKAQSSLADSLFHPDSLRHIVEVLAADSLEGRFTGTAGNLKAAFFIKDEFEKAGLKPVAGNNGFFMEIKPLWVNVVGAIKGRSKPGQVIIFSAHFDHVGTNKTNPFPGAGGRASVEEGDNIYNGANDNASGVAAVISLAKYLKAQDTNERTLLFVAFTGEELGLLGSQALAESFEPDSVIAMINIEMVGRSEYRSSKPFITGSEHSDIRKILNLNYRKYADKPEKEVFALDPYIRSFLFMRSDNYSFAQKGVPAHSIQLTSPDDIYYHNPNDEANTLDYQTMQRVIKAIAYGVTGLITGIDKPTRIKKL